MASRKRPYIEPRAVKEILPAILRGLKKADRGPVAAARAAWPEVAGGKVAERTRVASLEQGVLTVEVPSAALKHHLATFRGAEILEGLQAALPALRIRSVRYRVGRSA